LKKNWAELDLGDLELEGAEEIPPLRRSWG